MAMAASGNDETAEDIEDLDEAKTIKDAQDIYFSDETLLTLVGINKPMQSLEQRDDIVKSIINYLAKDCIREAAEQFKEGLASCGILAYMKQYTVLRELMEYKEEKISGEAMKKMFKVKYTAAKESKRGKLEAKRAAWFVELLDIIDKGATQMTFGDVLCFATGLEAVPAIGFDPSPSVTFQHREDIEQKLDPKAKLLARGNTCSNEIILPVDPMKHRRFVRFKEDLELAFKGSKDTFTAEIE